MSDEPDNILKFCVALLTSPKLSPGLQEAVARLIAADAAFHTRCARGKRARTRVANTPASSSLDATLKLLDAAAVLRDVQRTAIELARSEIDAATATARVNAATEALDRLLR